MTSRHGMTKEEALEMWKLLIADKQELNNEIDPDMSVDWLDMAYGFFLGLQFTPAEAGKIARQCQF